MLALAGPLRRVKLRTAAYSVRLKDGLHGYGPWLETLSLAVVQKLRLVTKSSSSAYEESCGFPALP